MRFRNCVKLSMRESNKLDRVIKQVQYLTERRIATPNTKDMFDSPPSIFDCHQAMQSSIEQHRAQFNKWSNGSNISPRTNVVCCLVKCWIRFTRALAITYESCITFGTSEIIGGNRHPLAPRCPLLGLE